MFESQLKHGEALLNRIIEQHKYGSEKVPAHVAAFENELVTWYKSVANVLTDSSDGTAPNTPPRRGKPLSHREGLALLWQQGFDEACKAKMSWTRSNDGDIVGSFIVYMRSMLTTLTALEGEAASRQFKLSDELTFDWLFRHVPIRFWTWSFGIVLGSFLLGTQSIRLGVVREALALPNCVSTQGSATSPR